MKHKPPKKAPAKYLEGAPPYVAGVYYHRLSNTYCTLFGWPIWEDLGHRSEYPFLETSPTGHGLSQWGSLPSITCRSRLGELVAWNDLPPELRTHIVGRANYPYPIKLGYLKADMMEKRGSKAIRWVKAWRLVDKEGTDIVQPWSRTRAEAIELAKHLKVILMGDYQHAVDQ